MSTFGDYDAAKVRTVNNNPYLDGGLRNVGSTPINDLGLKMEKTQPSWGVERTTSVTPEERIEENAQVTYATIENTLTRDVKDEVDLDEYCRQYITPASINSGTCVHVTNLLFGGLCPQFDKMSGNSSLA